MALVLEAVHRTYGPATALAGVSLTVAPGSVHVLAGPNGSGKTTLVRIALGLTRPDAGRVSTDGSRGAAFQEPSLFTDLTVGQNLAAFAGMAGAVDADWRDHVVEQLALAPVGDRAVGALSAGLRKRVDLAAGLLTGHAYICCDEPLADVDAPSRAAVVDLIDAVDAGVLVATHDVSRFASIADHVTVLDEGSVVHSGEADDGIDLATVARGHHDP